MMKMEINKAIFITSLAEYGPFEGCGLPQIAVTGRSNVGKSSLINKLTKQNHLAKTSGTPGKTRLINVFLINNAFHLVDLPGYGFAKVAKHEKERWSGMMHRYFEKASELTYVLQLVDIRHEPSEEDIMMNRFLRSKNIPFTVIITKADKVSRGTRMKYIAPILRALEVQPWEVIAFSSVHGTGREELLSLLAGVIAP
jgi:GTP-binding protein